MTIGAVRQGAVSEVPTALPPEDPAFAAASGLARRLFDSLCGVVLGTPGAVSVAVVAALSGEHLLVEDVPGVGKTLLAAALARSLGADLSRIQGHPDLLPSDVTGVTVFSQDTREWDFRPGPVFAHVVLLDELNRTPPRTQSALLEAMEEGQVSVDRTSWALPHPHLVLATQNPVGQLGTFPLVESQLDRFGLATSIGYPTADVEARLVLRDGGRSALHRLEPVCSVEEWERSLGTTAAVRVTPSVAEYAVTVVRATRSIGAVRLGASPRAAISLIRCAQAHAVLAGRPYATPDDVQAMAVHCLSHRLVTDGSIRDRSEPIRQILATTPVPGP